MIAKLNFDRPASHFDAEPPLEPGLRRIDELLALVLARYEGALVQELAPDQTMYRVSRPVFKEEFPCSC
jgi:hypothetical protein